MKKVWTYLVCGFLFSTSCEDFVEIDTPSEAPRLIIDALIPVDSIEQVIDVKVKVSLTSSFFGTIPVTGLKQITISNIGEDLVVPTDGGFSVLIEDENNPGTYESMVSREFLTEGNLVLQLNHENRLYFASAKYIPTVPIDSIAQITTTILGDEVSQIDVTFTDNLEQSNFYVFDFDKNQFLVSKDQFYQGQQFKFSYLYDQKFEKGTELQISLLGADQEFHNYMELLIEQSEDDIGLFDTPVATVRGNIFDVTDIDNFIFFDNVDQPNNFPLGYFVVCQRFSELITIE